MEVRLMSAHCLECLAFFDTSVPRIYCLHVGKPTGLTGELHDDECNLASSDPNTGRQAETGHLCKY